MTKRQQKEAAIRKAAERFVHEVNTTSTDDDSDYPFPGDDGLTRIADEVAEWLGIEAAEPDYDAMVPQGY